MIDPESSKTLSALIEKDRKARETKRQAEIAGGLPENSRRIVAVPVSMDLFRDMFTTGHRFSSAVHVVDGLPSGAKMVSSFYDHWRAPNTVILVFEHESFGLVPDGEMIPIKNILMHHSDIKVKEKL